MAESLADGGEDSLRLGNHLRADAVTGEDRDAMAHALVPSSRPFV